MSERNVNFEIKNGVGYITMDRPAKLNAITIPMTNRILQCLAEAANDSKVRVVVFRGVGRAFSTGADHKEMDSLLEKWRRDPFAYMNYLRTTDQKMILAIRAFDKPTIAAVNGYAIGVGSGIAYACDFRVASTEAKFQEVFVRIGLSPGEGAIALLSRLVGFSKATEMILSGKMVDAEEAFRMGLVTNVVLPDKLESEVDSLAKTLLNCAPLALKAAKSGLNRLMLSELELDMERAAFVLYSLKNTSDHQEALRAFLEKRSPKFKGE